jgi:hypothetical protein
MVTLLLEHVADVQRSSIGYDAFDRMSLSARHIYLPVREKLGHTGDSIVAIGDIVHAASYGSQAFSELLAHQKKKVSQKQLDRALCRAIRIQRFGIDITLALLEAGIDANGLTVTEPPSCSPPLDLMMTRRSF